MLDYGDAFRAEEHVLGAAEADAFCAEGEGALGVGLGIGVGHDTEAALIVGPGEEDAGFREFVQVGADGGDFAEEDLAGGAVDG